MAVSKVVLAKLSPTMEEGTIVKWNKKEGDPVKVGDVLAEIETDKANMEMESQGAGVLRKILVPAGGKAPIGTLIGVIAEPNEDIAPLIAKAGAAAKAAAPAAAPPKQEAAPQPAPAKQEAPAKEAAPKQEPAPKQDASAAPAPGGGAPADAETARAATPAPAKAAPAAAPTPPAPAPANAGGAAPQAPAEPSGEASRGAEGGRVKASPLARSMAAQKQIDLSSVSGSGPGGRIIKRDIESWSGGAQRAAASGGGAPAARPAAPLPSIAPGTEVPLTNMRKTIAKRLSESKFTAPHFYVTMEIAMDGAVDLREQIQRLEDVKVSFNDLVLKACAKALTRFPMVNASWMGDRIATHAEVHIGVAVAMPDGLIVPVVRNADRKSILDISREVKDLAARAKDRKLKPEEFTGSTFSISNMGMFDVSEFTAIINPPESAILAVGSVRKVPVVDGDDIRIGHRMNVTMSSDHRVVDGALAAQFLNEVRRLLESPVSLFV
jgi:pyruvate dehydrogenase E2 component (dihydrolipoamide acetyltransferase)